MFVFKHAFVQDAAYGTLLRGRRQELHAAIATALEHQSASASQHGPSAENVRRCWRIIGSGPRTGRGRSDLHVEAAERAANSMPVPKRSTIYWQALDLFERLPGNAERNRVHADVVLSLMWLPGFACRTMPRKRACCGTSIEPFENAAPDGSATAV